MTGSLSLRLNELETPALLVDLPIMESNLARAKKFFESAPAKLRPHYKNLKCPALAKRQLAAGAIGITCSTIREAQALVRYGVNDVLIANEIAGAIKISQFVELARTANVIVAVDHIDSVEALAQASRKSGVQLQIVVDVDVGLGRAGVQDSAAALNLVREAKFHGLAFRGLMGYEGRILKPPGPEREAACRAAMQRLVEARELIEKAGIRVEIVTASGTGSYKVASNFPGVTDIQAGSFLLMDTDYHRICPDFEPALSVLATVISTQRDRLVVDAGLKAISAERGLPFVKNIPGVQLRKLAGEHGILEILDASAAKRIGDTLEIWVHYGDATVNLHSRMYGVRDGFVEEYFVIERE